MKKIMKNNIFGFILCGLIFGGIVYAATLYKASDVSYTPTDESWEVSNVNDAINSLYNMKKELDNIKGLGDATASQILSGKKAMVKGNTITGTMTNRGAVTNTLNAGGSYTIPAGYHNGSGKVSCNYGDSVSFINPTLPFEVTGSMMGYSITGITVSTNSALYGTTAINFDNVSSIYVSCTNRGDASSSPVFYIAITDEILTTKEQIKANAVWSATQWGNYATTDTIDVKNKYTGYKYISLAIDPGYAYSYTGYWNSIKLQ